MGERRPRRSRCLVMSDQERPPASAIASHHQAMDVDHACVGLERANGSRVAMHTDADGESFLLPEAFLLIEKACAIGPVGWRLFAENGRPRSAGLPYRLRDRFFIGQQRYARSEALVKQALPNGTHFANSS